MGRDEVGLEGYGAEDGGFGREEAEFLRRVGIFAKVV